MRLHSMQMFFVFNFSACQGALEKLVAKEKEAQSKQQTQRILLERKDRFVYVFNIHSFENLLQDQTPCDLKSWHGDIEHTAVQRSASLTVMSDLVNFV